MGARLTLPQIRAALQRGGRKRNLDVVCPPDTRKASAPPISAAPGPVPKTHTERPSQHLVRHHCGYQPPDQRNLKRPWTTCFEQHPDAVIYHSQPRLGNCARAPGRSISVQGRPPPLHQRQVTHATTAGTSPITVASGRKRVVLARHVRKAASLRRFGPIGAFLFPNPTAQAPQRSTTRNEQPATSTTKHSEP